MYLDNDELHFSCKERGQLVEEALTPNEQEQLLLVLAGECPHNGGWIFHGHGHNDAAYKCALCGKIDWF